jgi:5-methylcytosine-specific restriction endonuclease McrBC GTP-binding regulatory subunit McrB
MNTADRSVEALDSALRRRFSFEELRPKPELLAELDQNARNIEGVDLVTLLKTINDRIELVLDKDHQIGHSYFIGITTIKGLKEAFVNKVFPLLEEYFFGDFGKIGLIVGGAFIEEVKKENKPKLPTNFTYEDANYFTEKKVYKYIDSDKWDAKAFISVYEDVKTGE